MDSISTSSPERRRSSSTETQITSFLTNLGNEAYRTNIREKLNEHRICKQAEIRVREEEIKVIEDVIQFINEFHSKHSPNFPSSITNSSLSVPFTTTIIDLTEQTKEPNREGSGSRVSGFKTKYDPRRMLQSPLTGAIEDLSPQPFPIVSHGADSPRVSSSKDETIDSLTYPLFSPQPGAFSISSPTTPFSIPSRPSPMTPGPLSISPPPPSPFPHSLSPLNNSSTTRDINNQIPSSVSSTSSSSSSSLSSAASSETTTTNSNIHHTEQSSKKSSFNRSLPHSLVS